MKELLSKYIMHSKIVYIYEIFSKYCLIIFLISAMILSFYLSTKQLLPYHIGTTILKLGIYIYSSIIVYCLAFEKILNDFEGK